MTDKKRHILCVEDNAENQVLLSFYVKKSPYQITYAGNGRKALELLKENTFDLFLVDLSLPDEISGFDVIKKIREDSRHKKTPVLVVSAYVKSETDGAMLEPYIDQYLTKPIRKAEFLKILESYLS